MDQIGWNMYVFRDGRRTVPAKELILELARTVNAIESTTNDDQVLTALLAAGELECALADAASSDAAAAAGITDRIAAILVRPERAKFKARELLSEIGRIEHAGEVKISVHEGFAYYALHPLKFGHVLEQLSLQRDVGVVGIRSIGSTLSAVTCEALRARGVRAERITVRPTGHPYDRTLELKPEDVTWIRRHRDCDFLVVDEGPGLSGSSFLAVAESLVRAGIDATRIVLIGTRLPHTTDLQAPNAASRWNRFRSVSTAAEPYLPPGAEIAVGGGCWRDRFLGEGAPRPGSWTQLERLKFISEDGRRFFRFEGYGHFGAELEKRGRTIASHAFGPGHLGNAKGFGCYELVDGRPLTENDVDEAILERLADYCSFRKRHFETSAEQHQELEAMLRFNWKNEFSAELPDEVTLKTEHPVIADARMAPYKWLRTSEGRLYKVDAVSHGDDHFFPGPCDIAWDLAGATVEWRLDADSQKRLLAKYEALSGDDVTARIPGYLLAYATFRFAYSRMAARAMGGTSEEAPLMRDYERYRSQALELFAREPSFANVGEPIIRTVESTGMVAPSGAGD